MDDSEGEVLSLDHGACKNHDFFFLLFQFNDGCSTVIWVLLGRIGTHEIILWWWAPIQNTQTPDDRPRFDCNLTDILYTQVPPPPPYHHYYFKWARKITSIAQDSLRILSNLFLYCSSYLSWNHFKVFWGVSKKRGVLWNRDLLWTHTKKLLPPWFLISLTANYRCFDAWQMRCDIFWSNLIWRQNPLLRPAMHSAWMHHYTAFREKKKVLWHFLTNIGTHNIVCYS